MTVGANEVLGGAVDAKEREQVPVEVVQSAGRGLAGQMVDGQRLGVTVAQGGELAGVPVAGGAAQQQGEAWRAQCLTEPAFPALSDDAGVWEPVASLGPSAQPGLAFLDDRAVPVADVELGDGAEAVGHGPVENSEKHTP